MILAGNGDIHKRLDEVEFGQGLKTDYGVSCHCASKDRCLHFFSVAIDPIHFRSVGNKDIHNI